MKFFKYILKIIIIFFSVLFIKTSTVKAATVSCQIANGYQYVSNSGIAAFNIPWRNKPGVQYDGNLTFWTQPGETGTPVEYGENNTVSTTSVNGSGDLPAYAANDSNTPIGKWILPTGTVAFNSNTQIKLELDKSFSGVIRPLKISLASQDPAGIFTYWEGGIGTLYPFSLTSTYDSEFDINATSGTATTNFEKGSYLNTSSQPDAFDGEISMTLIQANTMSLFDDTDKPVNELDMTDSTGEVIGTWYVSSDQTQILWKLNGNKINGQIQKIKYGVQDIRNNSWSGWWDQSPENSSNTLGGVASYNTAYLIPK